MKKRVIIGFLSFFKYIVLFLSTIPVRHLSTLDSCLSWTSSHGCCACFRSQVWADRRLSLLVRSSACFSRASQSRGTCYVLASFWLPHFLLGPPVKNWSSCNRKRFIVRVWSYHDSDIVMSSFIYLFIYLFSSTFLLAILMLKAETNTILNTCHTMLYMLVKELSKSFSDDLLLLLAGTEGDSSSAVNTWTVWLRNHLLGILMKLLQAPREKSALSQQWVRSHSSWTCLPFHCVRHRPSCSQDMCYNSFEKMQSCWFG